MKKLKKVKKPGDLISKWNAKEAKETMKHEKKEGKGKEKKEHTLKFKGLV